LRWLDQPPAAAFAQAQDLLARLGAFRPGSRDTLSEHGQAMAELPAHPRIAHLLLRGQDLGLAQMACDVAALLGERDILRGGGADLHSRLALVSGESKAARGGQGVCSVLVSWPGSTVACCVARPVHRSPTRTTRAGWAPCWRWPTRPRRPAAPRGRRGVSPGQRPCGAVWRSRCVDEVPWLVIADLGSRQGQREERIYLAAEFDPALFDGVLAEQVERVDILDWDEREQVLRAERQRKVGELVLSREPLPGLDDEAGPGRCLAWCGAKA
jgi:ATP-dependent helicase HrpB